MVDFEKVLDEIEERRRRFENAPSAPAVSLSKPPVVLTAQFCMRADRAAATYRMQQTEPQRPANPEPTMISPENVRAILALGRLPRKRLETLRRKIAWRLHPDRCAAQDPEASRAMAEINAAIDQALAASSP
jgi:hypothetical protein